MQCHRDHGTGPALSSAPVAPRYTRGVTSEPNQLNPSEATAIVKRARVTAVLQLIRGVFQLSYVVIITVWAFISWPMPLALATGFGALILTVLLWALFLSPKPVLRTDRFGQALIELLMLAGAVAALLSFGTDPVTAVVYGVVAAGVSYFASIRVK